MSDSESAIMRPALIAKIQDRSTTKYDREPALFKTVSELLRASHPTGGLNVLSFGCAAGEEAFTLADKYLTFENDRILGVDVLEQQIDLAKKRNKLERVEFKLSTTDAISARAPFHAIFALSVLCVWPATKDVSDIGQIFPFTEFKSICEQLSYYLSIGGFFSVYNSNFCFKDLDIYRDYQPIQIPMLDGSGYVKKFDRNNQMYERSYSYNEALFKKLR